MAISGSLTNYKIGPYLDLRICYAFLFICTAFVFVGCSVKYGQIPAIDKLESSLTPLENTKADVLQVLGPPNGYGRARLPGRDHKAQTLWFYDYIKSDAINEQIEIVMLLIFFDEEKYVNHLWFSSHDKIKKIKN